MKKEATYKFLLILSLIIFIFNSGIAASKMLKPSNPNKQVQHYNPNVPEGFEHLDSENLTYADIYYGGLFLGSYEIRYTPETLQFLTPHKIVLELNNVSKPGKIEQVLKGKLSNHTSLVCRSLYEQNCGILKPKVAGVIFNLSTFRVDIFVNPSYIKNALLPGQLLPASSAGFSYINNLRGVISGTNTSRAYNIYSYNTFGYRQGRVVSNLSYANSTDGDSQLQVNNLNMSWNYSCYDVQIGALYSDGNTFLAGESILGARWGTNLDTITNDSNIYGNPLQIFLASPSKISVYRDNRLLSSQFYPAGKQLINTTSFPDGAYNVLLKIEHGNGTATQETWFFVKTASLPPAKYPNYYMSAGYLEKRNTMRTIFPAYTRTPLFTIGMAKRIKSSFGIIASSYRV